MATLARAGLAPVDAKLVLEYENVHEYLAETMRNRKIERLEELKLFSQAMRAASHATKDSFEAWLAYIDTTVHKLNERDEDAATVFDRIKRNRTDTLFDRIKRARNGT